MARRLVGLDLGSHTVRAVALRPLKAGFALAGCAAVARHDADGEERPLGDVVAELKRQLDPGRSPVAAISQVASLVRYVSTAPLSPERLARSLRLELEQSVEDGAELAADTFTLPLPGEEMRHCCVFAQAPQVRATLTDLERAKARIGQLTFAPAALHNSALPLPPVEGDDLALLIDIGAQTTSVALVGDGRLLACRQLPIGGKAFTDALATAQGLTAVQAEARKLASPAHATEPAATDTQRSAIAPIISTAVDMATTTSQTIPALPDAVPTPVPPAATTWTLDDDITIPATPVPAPATTNTQTDTTLDLDLSPSTGSGFTIDTASSPTATASPIARPELDLDEPLDLDLPTATAGDLELDDGADHDRSAPSPAVTTTVDQHLLDDDCLVLLDDHQAAPLPIAPVDTPAAAVMRDDVSPSVSASGSFLPTPMLTDAALRPAASPTVNSTTFIAALPPVPPPGRATQLIARSDLGPELVRVAESLYGQLASSIAWFRTQLGLTDIVVARVVLSGGGAGLAGLDTYLARRFAVPVVRHDPFQALVCDRCEPPTAPHAFAVAVGLALAAPGGHRQAVRIDLLPEGILRQRAWMDRLVWPYVAAGALLLAAGLTGWTWLAEQGATEDALSRFDQAVKQLKQKTGQIEQVRQEREALSEDLRAIASRIYAARDLLNTVRALKEQTASSKELWVTSLKTSDVGGESSDDKGRRTVRAKPQLHDTAIDRGGVIIGGLVKFDGNKTSPELTEFFNRWRLAMLEWRPAPGQPTLFSGRRVNVFDIKYEKDGNGRVPFSVEFSFQPTDLNAVTTRDEGAPAGIATPSEKATP
jgi:Tfp pilus assembly PilM family ATPase